MQTERGPGHRTPLRDEHGSNRGLGLHFFRLAVEAHGGTTWVDEQAAMPTVSVGSFPAETVQ